MQVPLLTVLESVVFERSRGRSPMFQSWFDIQPLSLESDLSLEGLQAVVFGKVRLSRPAAMLRRAVPAPAVFWSCVHLCWVHVMFSASGAVHWLACARCVMLLGALRIIHVRFDRGAWQVRFLRLQVVTQASHHIPMRDGIRRVRQEIWRAQADNRAMAKMDLELWMQEDGTNMFGAVLYSADIYDLATAQRAATHILVCLRTLAPLLPPAPIAIFTIADSFDTLCWTKCRGLQGFAREIQNELDIQGPRSAS